MFEKYSSRDKEKSSSPYLNKIDKVEKKGYYFLCKVLNRAARPFSLENKMRIEEIDKNMQYHSAEELGELEWYDIRKEEAFDIYGLYKPRSEKEFKRMPTEVAEKVNEGVLQFHGLTAGGRVRFGTDSSVIAVLAETDPNLPFGNMSPIATAAFDLYRTDKSGQLSYRGTFAPPYSITDSYSAYVGGLEYSTDYLIHFPTYQHIKSLYIGIERGKSLFKSRSYRSLAPIVFLGSSITQGGCASRAGNGFVNVISRTLDMDIVNLGFSGSCRGEPEMAEYVASLPASVFVCDYDHNAPNAEHLKATHYPLYRLYRDKNPDTPIVFISKPDWICDPNAAARREVIRETYRRAVEEGDSRVWIIDGEQLFAGERYADCTVDSCHPNDLGNDRMARVIGGVLKEILGI